MYLFKKYPEFFNFVKLNKIDDVTLKNTLGFIRHVKVKKGQYIYKQGDHSDGMYGIMLGKITLLEYIKENSEKNSYGTYKENILELFKISEDPAKIMFLNSRGGFRNLKAEENEKKNYGNSLLSTNFYKRLQENFLKEGGKKIELIEGMCFGYSDLINHRRRSQSACAIEDSELFFIEKENFEFTLYKSLMKADSERVVFIHNMLPIFNFLPKKKFDELVEECVEYVIYKENEIIYEEGEKPEYIYLVYQGECCLKRDITKPYIFKSDELEIKNDEEPSNKNSPNKFPINHQKNNSNTFLYFSNSTLITGLQRNSTDSLIDTNLKYETIDYSTEILRSPPSNVNGKNKTKYDSNQNKIAQNRNQERKFFMISNKNIETILKINTGDLIGLESIVGLPSFNHTLISSNSFTVVAKLNVNKLNEFKHRIFNYLLPIFIEKEKIIEDFVKNHRKVHLKRKFKFLVKTNFNQQSSIKVGNNDVDRQYQKDIDSEFEEKVKFMIEEAKKHKGGSINTIKDIKFLTIDKSDQNSFRRNLSKIPQDDNKSSINHNIIKSNNHSKLEVSDISSTNNVNKYFNFKNNSKNRTLMTIFSDSKLSKHDKGTSPQLSRSQTKKNLKIFDNSINNFTNDKSLNNPYDVMKSYKLSKNVLFNKEIVRSLKHEQKNTNKPFKHKKQFSYNSGYFDMPLISFNMENLMNNHERIHQLEKEIFKHEGHEKKICHKKSILSNSKNRNNNLSSIDRY